VRTVAKSENSAAVLSYEARGLGHTKVEEGKGAQHDGAGSRHLLMTLVRGLGWSTGARIVSAVGGTLRYIIFARLLTPVDFGIFGAAVLCFDFVYTMFEPNIEVALVPMEKEIEPYLDTIWTLQILKAVVISAILGLASHDLAMYFRIGSAQVVFISLAPLAILRGLKSPASTALIYRELNFRLSFILCAAELSCGFLVGLTGLFWWRDWRLLVLLTTAGQLARTSLTFYYYPYKPRLRVDWARTRELFRFGRWITLKQVALHLARRLDDLAVGHLLGPLSLAEYQMAFRMGEIPAGEFAISASSVAFPLSGQLRQDSAKGSRLFYGTIGLAAFIGILYWGVISLWGRTLVLTVLGAKWVNVVGPLQILCLYGICQGVLAIGTSFLEGLGRPSKSFQITLLRTALLGLLIYPMTRKYGTIGAALAGLVSVIPPLVQMYLQWRQAVGVKSFQFAQPQKRPLNSELARPQS
jgi:O-antigen/teichoic acid export membrane protein